MRVSIFGLGYVGAVSAACFSKERHSVIGVDLNQTKVDIINSGKTPLIEKDLDRLIHDAVRHKLLRATTDGEYAVFNSDISFICVGTPSNKNGSLNLKYLERVSKEIGGYLKAKKDYHIVVIRSTMLPGSTEEILIPILERESGVKAGQGFGIVVNPEFMRESSAVYDFYNPPKTVIGGVKSSDINFVARLYEDISAPLIRASIKVAEMIKYVDNSFHALKITFGNEIGAMCKALNIDSHEIMNVFCQDDKLNLSSVYLKPGFAFGGSCLPKDLRALSYKAKMLDVDIPMLSTIMSSNELQVRSVLDRIISSGKKKIGVLGFAFKAGTDDLRESPIVELIESLLGKGFDIKIYDKGVSLAKLFGANKEYIEKRIPHISKLMVENMNEIVEQSEMIIIGNKNEEFLDIFPLLRKDQHVLDLVRIARSIETNADYEGIYW
jgi:GDP-mannose 6-dehydrogenase